MQPSESAGVSVPERPPKHTTPTRLQRATSRRMLLSRSRDSLVVVSTTLVLESRLLLLHCAQRSFLTSKTKDALKAVDKRHEEVRRAEAALRSREIEPLPYRSAGHWARVYTSLVALAVNARARLTAVCADLPVDERFQTAADIQMLEDLIAQWTAAIKTIKKVRGGGAKRP